LVAKILILKKWKIKNKELTPVQRQLQLINFEDSIPKGQIFLNITKRFFIFPLFKRILQEKYFLRFQHV